MLGRATFWWIAFSDKRYSSDLKSSHFEPNSEIFLDLPAKRKKACILRNPLQVGFLQEDFRQRQTALLDRLGLPVRVPKGPVEPLLAVMRRDSRSAMSSGMRRCESRPSSQRCLRIRRVLFMGITSFRRHHRHRNYRRRPS